MNILYSFEFRKHSFISFYRHSQDVARPKLPAKMQRTNMAPLLFVFIDQGAKAPPPLH